MFEGQMRMLKHHQALEEQKLLLSGSHAIHDNDIASALSHGLAPGSRLNNGSLFSGVSLGTPQSAFHSPANATEKRKSVNYADYTEYTTYSPNASATHAHTVTMPSVSQFGSHTHIAGAKSMPGLRRGSGNHGNLPGINLQGLSIRDGSSTTGQAGQGGILKNGAGGIFGPTASQPSKGFNPGFLLDKELDKELSRHESVNFLPLSSEDDRGPCSDPIPTPSYPHRAQHLLSPHSPKLLLAVPVPMAAWIPLLNLPNGLGSPELLVQATPSRKLAYGTPLTPVPLADRGPYGSVYSTLWQRVYPPLQCPRAKASVVWLENPWDWEVETWRHLHKTQTVLSI
ncbi:pumilio homology domain family member 4 [Ceratobasidium sp. AG-Ba]|nr:pumilio homology domain family member 4 [Ceratobasidium sp. AG-Ba]